MDEFLNAIGSLSPIIGTALGGPVGAIVGKGIGLLTSAITGTSDPAAQLQVLQADPNKLAELEEQTKALHLQAVQSYIADTQNARKQTVDLATAHSAIAWGAPIISVMIVSGFSMVVYLLFSLIHTNDKPDPTLMTVMTSIVSIFSTLMVAVANYWLGSSAGSASKTNLLAAANSIIPSGAK